MKAAEPKEDSTFSRAAGSGAPVVPVGGAAADPPLCSREGRRRSPERAERSAQSARKRQRSDAAAAETGPRDIGQRKGDVFGASGEWHYGPHLHRRREGRAAARALAPHSRGSRFSRIRSPFFYRFVCFLAHPVFSGEFPRRKAGGGSPGTGALSRRLSSAKQRNERASKAPHKSLHPPPRFSSNRNAFLKRSTPFAPLRMRVMGRADGRRGRVREPALANSSLPFF